MHRPSPKSANLRLHLLAVDVAEREINTSRQRTPAASTRPAVRLVFVIALRAQNFFPLPDRQQVAAHLESDSLLIREITPTARRNDCIVGCRLVVHTALTQSGIRRFTTNSSAAPLDRTIFCVAGALLGAIADRFLP